jgi:alcohol dehydrogenase class IV
MLTLLVVWRRRKEPIIAIGGGVCLDVAGLSANLYRRNTPVIKVPIRLPKWSCCSPSAALSVVRICTCFGVIPSHYFAGCS